MTGIVRIMQLSDTHFLEDGVAPEGGVAYDTGEAFDAVFNHIGDHGDLDMVVVTGDVADHGRAVEYRKAADAFSRFEVPVNVCPGNHDVDAVFSSGMARPRVSTSRVVEVDAWAFLFVDSSAGTMLDHESGLRVDSPGETRLHTQGTLGQREAAWVNQMCETTNAEHVFVWVHHPPEPPLRMCRDDAYAAEWHGILSTHSKIRGFGAGHTHIPDDYEIMGRPVFVSPSLKNNFSLDPQTWLPPGYRTYEFMDDGSVTSEVQLVDDERWPRHPFGRLLGSLFRGEITFSEMDEIIARRNRVAGV
jgi:3',5'-cyclic AMP phosphodiesterase CpdA